MPGRTSPFGLAPGRGDSNGHNRPAPRGGQGGGQGADGSPPGGRAGPRRGGQQGSGRVSSPQSRAPPSNRPRRAGGVHPAPRRSAAGPRPTRTCRWRTSCGPVAAHSQLPPATRHPYTGCRPGRRTTHSTWPNPRAYRLSDPVSAPLAPHGVAADHRCRPGHHPAHPTRTRRRRTGCRRVTARRSPRNRPPCLLAHHNRFPAAQQAGDEDAEGQGEGEQHGDVEEPDGGGVFEQGVAGEVAG